MYGKNMSTLTVYAFGFCVKSRKISLNPWYKQPFDEKNGETCDTSTGLFFCGKILQVVWRCLINNVVQPIGKE